MSAETGKRNETICKKYAAGETIDNLSRKYGIGVYYIRDLIKKGGIDLTRKKTAKRDSASRNRYIVESFKNGSTPKQIAKNIGRTEVRVKQVLRTALGSFNNVQHQLLLDKIKEMRVAGKTYRHIQDKYGAVQFKKVLVYAEIELSDIFEEIRAEIHKDTSYDNVLDNYGTVIVGMLQDIGLNIKVEYRSYRNDKISKLYRQGISPEEIADSLDMTRDYVYRILRVKEGSIRKNNERVIGIISDHIGGMAVDDIATKYMMDPADAADLIRVHDTVIREAYKNRKNTKMSASKIAKRYGASLEDVKKSFDL